MNIEKSPDGLHYVITTHMSIDPTFQEFKCITVCRTTKINGNYLIHGYDTPKPVREDIPRERKLLGGCTFIPQFQFLRARSDPSMLQIIYHNIQSLPMYYADIASDHCYMKSDVLLFAETCTINGDHFEFDGFDQWQVESVRKPGGVSIYIKKRLTPLVENVIARTHHILGIYILTIHFKTNFRLAVLYAEPELAIENIKNQIDKALLDEKFEWKTVLVGNFNIDMNSDSGKEFRETLSLSNYLQLRSNPNEYTTEGRINAVFSTHGLKTGGVYKSAFSYPLEGHLPIYIHLPWEHVEVPGKKIPEEDEKLKCGPDLLDG